MRDNHWPFGVINGFECRSLSAMGHVNHHADSIHFFNDLLTKACESAVFILITPACQEALVVIGELHNHESQPSHNFDQPNLILDR